MFKRSFKSGREASQRDVAMTDSQHRVDKSARLMKKSGSVRDRDHHHLTKLARLQRSLAGEEAERPPSGGARLSEKSLAPSPIVTLTVGREGRLFAAHEDVLCRSPFFAAALSAQYMDLGADPQMARRIALPDEEPEVFSAILEYLYKGDYYPRLLQNKHRGSWELEDSLPASSPGRSPAVGGGGGRSPQTTHLTGGGRAVNGGHPGSPQTPAAVEATVYLSSVGQYLLRDTVIYCAAERYGLEELKRLSLRKQGLQAGIDVGTILRSAQYCYAHTPDSDSRLRAHYLALIIRCRKTFKRSGTMQAEMEQCGSGGVYGEAGGKLFFDLFVAMCNHLDDVIDASNARTPKTV